MYTAYLSHHSISQSRSINVSGSLSKAKMAASREFKGEMNDYRIVIVDNKGETVAQRNVDAKSWLTH